MNVRYCRPTTAASKPTCQRAPLGPSPRRASPRLRQVGSSGSTRCPCFAARRRPHLRRARRVMPRPQWTRPPSAVRTSRCSAARGSCRLAVARSRRGGSGVVIHIVTPTQLPVPRLGGSVYSVSHGSVIGAEFADFRHFSSVSPLTGAIPFSPTRRPSRCHGHRASVTFSRHPPATHAPTVANHAFLTSVPARKTSLLYKGKNLHLIQCNSI